MSIFKRMKTVVSSNINDALDRAEDPEKIIKQSIIDMEKQVQGLVTALGQAKASENQMLKQLEATKKDVEEWQKKAELAAGAGNEELARKALSEKVSAQGNIATYQANYEQMHSQVAELESKVKVVTAKLNETKGQQKVMIARARMAESQKEISKTFSGADSTSAYSKIEKMNEKIESREAEAEAYTAMDPNSVFAKDEFAELEKTSAVDDELAKLMGK